jgi:hypothetical protein
MDSAVDSPAEQAYRAPPNRDLEHNRALSSAGARDHTVAGNSAW